VEHQNYYFVCARSRHEPPLFDIPQETKIIKSQSYEKAELRVEQFCF
jgi:hypothetical protein